MRIAFQGCFHDPAQPYSPIWACEEDFLKALAGIDGRNSYLLFNHGWSDPAGLARRLADPRAPNFSVHVARLPQRLVRLAEGSLGLDLRGLLLRRLGAQALHIYEHIYPAPPRFPTIVTFHNMYPELHPQWASPGIRSVMRYNAGRAAHILATSESTKRDIVRLYGTPAERISVVPYGINHGLFRPLPPERLEPVRRKLALPERYLLCVGPVTPRKNIAYAVEGLRRMGREHSLGLVLVGGRTPLRDELEAGARQDGLPLLLAGEVTHEELAALYNMASLFVYPSPWFGVPILEAMACGCPVATSRNDWTLEAAGDAALFLELEDPGDLARKAAEVLEEPERRRALAEKGLAAARRFTWEEAARRTIEVYERVAGSR